MFKRLLAVFLLAFTIPVFGQAQPDTPSDFIHISIPDQDFMCGMARYGLDVPQYLAYNTFAKIGSTLDKAEEVYHPVRHFFRRALPFLHISNYYRWPYITFDIPSQLEAAGVYYADVDRININPVYLNKFGWKMIDEVVVHETAHKIDYAEHKKLYDTNPQLDPHGQTWRQVMVDLGVTPHTYHDYSFCDEFYHLNNEHPNIN